VKQKILVTRATFDDVIARLRERFEVEDNRRRCAWSAEEFRRRLADKDGSFPRVRTAWTRDAGRGRA